MAQERALMEIVQAPRRVLAAIGRAAGRKRGFVHQLFAHHTWPAPGAVADGDVRLVLVVERDDRCARTNIEIDIGLTASASIRPAACRHGLPGRGEWSSGLPS